jgi:DNA-binding MarR family transcriptional regulator
MPLLMLKDLPRYECLLEASRKFPDLDPSAMEVYLQLLRTGDDLYRLQNEYLAAHALSQGRFCVLMLLLEKGTEGTACEKRLPGGSQSPAELADHANVTRATMTGLIDTLEKDGLVKREPDPDDRRMMSVELTPKAHAFMAGMLPGYFRRIAGFMSHLSEEERRTLVQLLGKIHEGLATSADEAVAASGAAPSA